LLDGTSYEGFDTGEAFSVRKFGRFEGFLPEIQITVPSPKKFEIPSSELAESSRLDHQSLYQWRWIVPISILVLGLLGLRMSKSGPREGRFGKVFFALVLYVIYNQLLVTSREAVNGGSLPPEIGLWPIPVLFLLLALYQGQFVPKWFYIPSIKWRVRTNKKDIKTGNTSA